MTKWCLFVEEDDFGNTVDPDIVGCAVVAHTEDGLTMRLVHRPDIDQQAAYALAEWVIPIMERFSQYGPDMDDWQERSDGGWQKWVRAYHLPTPY